MSENEDGSSIRIGCPENVFSDEGQTEMSAIYLAGIESVVIVSVKKFAELFLTSRLEFLIFASQRCIAVSGPGSISPQKYREDAPKQATSKRTQRGYHAAKVLQITFAPAHSTFHCRTVTQTGILATFCNQSNHTESKVYRPFHILSAH